MTSINANKQEMNRIHHSKRKSSDPYRAGYLDALKTFAKFLDAHAKKRQIDSGLMKGSLSALRLALGAGIASQCDRLSPRAKQFFETAAEIIGHNSGDPEFVDWWLREYGFRMLSSDSDESSPLFPDRPAPRTEAELDLLEFELDRRINSWKSRGSR